MKNKNYEELSKICQILVTLRGGKELCDKFWGIVDLIRKKCFFFSVWIRRIFERSLPFFKITIENIFERNEFGVVETEASRFEMNLNRLFYDFFTPYL